MTYSGGNQCSVTMWICYIRVHQTRLEDHGNFVCVSSGGVKNQMLWLHFQRPLRTKTFPVQGQNCCHIPAHVLSLASETKIEKYFSIFFFTLNARTYKERVSNCQTIGQRNECDTIGEECSPVLGLCNFPWVWPVFVDVSLHASH